MDPIQPPLPQAAAPRPVGAEALTADVVRYRAALAGVEEEARGQRWSAERPWRVDTHVGADWGMPAVDLHDLSAAVARTAVREVLKHPPDTGAVLFVFGRGRHTLGPSQVLRNVVAKELRRVCADRAEWSYRMVGGARSVWITDRSRAPRAATGEWGWGFPLFLALLVLALLVALLHAAGVL